MQTKHMIGAAILGIALPMGAVAGEDKAEKLIDKLNLEGDRANQVEQVLEDFHDQKMQVKERAHEQIDSLKDQKKEKLKSILTEEEFDRLQSIMEETHGKHHKQCKDKGHH